jgi:hypothetical protein
MYLEAMCHARSAQREAILSLHLPLARCVLPVRLGLLRVFHQILVLVNAAKASTVPLDPFGLRRSNAVESR